MTKKFFIMCMAMVWTVSLMAQNISVVASDGSTSLYRTLQAAIEGAAPNSVIYLPGGGFPISDEVKITKKLTIIGIGHKIDTENVDGYTTISGPLFFNQGSDGSALMGVYVSDNVVIGNDGKVDDVLVRYCSIPDLDVQDANCMGITIDQNYIRGGAYFNGSSAIFSNNITTFVRQLYDGFISYNLIRDRWGYSDYSNAMDDCNRTSITNNIIINETRIHNGSDCLVSGNMLRGVWGEDCINIGEADWNDVFKDWNNGTISPASDFHFSDTYSEYENKVGIYAGGSNFDKQMAPVPYIVAKHVDEHTDTTGKLNIKIRVKAGQ